MSPRLEVRLRKEGGLVSPSHGRWRGIVKQSGYIGRFLAARVRAIFVLEPTHLSISGEGEPPASEGDEAEGGTSGKRAERGYERGIEFLLED